MCINDSPLGRVNPTESTTQGAMLRQKNCAARLKRMAMMAERQSTKETARL